MPDLVNPLLDELLVDDMINDLEGYYEDGDLNNWESGFYENIVEINLKKDDDLSPRQLSTLKNIHGKYVK